MRQAVQDVVQGQGGVSDERGDRDRSQTRFHRRCTILRRIAAEVNRAHAHKVTQIVSSHNLDQLSISTPGSVVTRPGVNGRSPVIPHEERRNEHSLARGGRTTLVSRLPVTSAGVPGGSISGPSGGRMRGNAVRSRKR
jgi:hypothetical protein